MEKIYLNLTETNKCYRSGGHRTSDGWVNSYKVDIDYSLTLSREDVILPLSACCILQSLMAQYSGSHEYDSDRYGYIDEYCYVNNIDISTFISELNLAQKKYQFIPSSEPLEFIAWSVVNKSRNEDSNVSNIVRMCNSELEKQIKNLEEDNRRKIITLTFPHIRNLIIEDQLDFLTKYEGVNSYPLDLLAIHQEYELLITNILKHKSPSYENPNEVYTLLTTGVISYFDILNGTVPHLDEKENLVLSGFLREMERKYRHENYQSIGSSFPLSPNHLVGLCNLYGHLLEDIDISKCYEMIDYWEYSSLPERQRSVFSFHSRYLFPYFIIALLAKEKDLNKDSFLERYKYNSGFDDIALIFDKCGVYFKNLIPYFKEIVNKQDAIDILCIILQHTNFDQYNRDRIKKREIFTCRSNFEKCKIFVENMLYKFISEE